MWKTSKAANLVFLWTFILNSVKHNFSLWVSLRKTIRYNQKQPPEPATLLKKEALAQVFSCEFCEISKNTCFTEHLWATASGYHFRVQCTNRLQYYLKLLRSWKDQNISKNYGKYISTHAYLEFRAYSLSQWLYHKIIVKFLFKLYFTMEHQRKLMWKQECDCTKIMIKKNSISLPPNSVMRTSYSLSKLSAVLLAGLYQQNFPSNFTKA